MKSVKIFGKSVPLLTIVMISLLVVGASATLLSYYGGIISTVTVEQAIKVNGNAYNVPIEDSATIQGGETFISDLYHIQSYTSVPVTIKLGSTVSPAEHDATWYEFTISMAGVQDGSNPWSDWDRVVTKSPVATVNEITTLSFEYMLTTSASGYSPYFVLELDTDDDGEQDAFAVSWQDTVTSDEWHTHDGITAGWHIGLGIPPPITFADVKTNIGSAKILAMKVMVGFWSDYNPTTALVKNIKLNNQPAIGSGIIIPPETATVVEGTVDFQVCVSFPENAEGSYTVTTLVNIP